MNNCMNCNVGISDTEDYCEACAYEIDRQEQECQFCCHILPGHAVNCPKMKVHMLS